METSYDASLGISGIDLTHTNGYSRQICGSNVCPGNLMLHRNLTVAHIPQVHDVQAISLLKHPLKDLALVRELRHCL